MELAVAFSWVPGSPACGEFAFSGLVSVGGSAFGVRHEVRLVMRYGVCGYLKSGSAPARIRTVASSVSTPLCSPWSDGARNLTVLPAGLQERVWVVLRRAQGGHCF